MFHACWGCGWMALPFVRITAVSTGQIKPGNYSEKHPPRRCSGEPEISNVLVKRKWFAENFADLEEDAPVLRVEQYCRAYMIGFFSDILFTDPNGDCYSLMPMVILEDMNNLHEWAFGSGVLAYLYRELCKSTGPDRKNMGGCVLLLQLWAWQHFATGRPRASLHPERLNTFDDPDYNDTVGMLWTDARVKDDPSTTHLWANRDMFDSIPPSDIFWAPYELYRARLPPICEGERTTALLSVPLIYFWIVERYRPERVMRQFGYRQIIPPEIPEADKMAEKELRELTNHRGYDWPTLHMDWIRLWDEKWYLYTEMGPLEPYTPLDTDGYMSWYWQNSDPLVQSTICYGSSTYRPMVPEKRMTAQKAILGCRVGLRLLREFGATMRVEVRDGVKTMLGCHREICTLNNEYPADAEWDVLNEEEGEEGGQGVSQLTQMQTRYQTRERGRGRGRRARGRGARGEDV